MKFCIFGDKTLQTFLPHPSFEASGRVLDRKRLGQQRNEAFQILKILIRKKTEGEEAKIGYKNHPAVLMWEGYEGALSLYIEHICTVWKQYGYKDTILNKTLQLVKDNSVCFGFEYFPWWVGINEFHDSHKAALLYKNPEWYKQFWSYMDPKLDYWWPTKNIEAKKQYGNLRPLDVI